MVWLQDLTLRHKEADIELGLTKSVGLSDNVDHWLLVTTTTIWIRWGRRVGLQFGIPPPIPPIPWTLIIAPLPHITTTTTIPPPMTIQPPQDGGFSQGLRVFNLHHHNHHHQRYGHKYHQYNHHHQSPPPTPIPPEDMMADSFSQSILAGGLAATTHLTWKQDVCLFVYLFPERPAKTSNI